MANQTALQIVNRVLRKLREDEVTDIESSAYSKLIFDFVNDSKEEVEDAWTWSSLTKPVTFTSVIGVLSYDLSDGSVVPTSGQTTNERSILLYDQWLRPMAFDVTNGTESQLYELETLRREREISLAVYQSTQQPSVFSLDSNGDGFLVLFSESPSQARNYKFYFKTPQDELTANADTLLIPWRPVYLGALFAAYSERGEEIGEPGSVAEMNYKNSLANYISLDAKKDPSKTQFEVV